MRTVLVAICVATASAPRLHAQAVERAVLLARLGADTLSVESYTRTRDRLEGYRALRAPRVELLHYVATLDSAGRIVRFEGSTSSGQAPGRTSRVVIAGDSADVTVLAGDSTRTYRTGARPGAVPMPSSVYALYEQMIRQALRVPEHAPLLRARVVLHRRMQRPQVLLEFRARRAQLQRHRRDSGRRHARHAPGRGRQRTRRAAADPGRRPGQ